MAKDKPRVQQVCALEIELPVVRLLAAPSRRPVTQAFLSFFTLAFLSHLLSRVYIQKDQTNKKKQQADSGDLPGHFFARSFPGEIKIQK